MKNTLKAFKARALTRPDVRREYDRLAEEFAFLDDILKARTRLALAKRKSLLESGRPSRRGSPRIIARRPFPFHCHAAALCSALGYKLQVDCQGAASNCPLNADARKIRARR